MLYHFFFFFFFFFEAVESIFIFLNRTDYDFSDLEGVSSAKQVRFHVAFVPF
jgi:hypothetical protein